MEKVIMKFKLKEIRESREISQSELARRTGLTVITIQNYERGTKKQYSHELLEKFCEVLNCQPGELFTIERELIV
jgi:putative transcriptional regulator